MNRALVPLSPILAGAIASSVGCKKPPPEDPPPPTTIASARETVPPAASFNATPVAELADSGSTEGQTPLEQARSYKASGQLWMARLHLENRALSSTGTKEEAELLLEICTEQGDEACVEKCGEKLNRKIKLDAGARAAGTGATTPPEHREPDTELARARDMVLKMHFAEARKVLEPKVIDGKATREEIRLLKTICEREGDRMCVALCNTKLK